MGVSRNEFLNTAGGAAFFALLAGCGTNAATSVLPGAAGLSTKGRATASLKLDVKTGKGGSWLWGHGHATPSSKSKSAQVFRQCGIDGCPDPGGDLGPGGERPAATYAQGGFTSYGYHDANAAQLVDDFGSVVTQTSVAAASQNALSASTVADTGATSTVTTPPLASIPTGTVVNFSAAGTQGAQLYLDPAGTSGSIYLPDFGLTVTVTYNADGSVTLHPSDGSPDIVIAASEMVALLGHQGYRTATIGQCFAETVKIVIMVTIIISLGIVITTAIRFVGAGVTLGVAGAAARNAWAARNYLC